MKKLIPTEDQECFAFVNYLEARRLEFTHIPNETYTPHWGVRMKLKKLGVQKGFPDYLIITKKKLLFVEMKRVKQSQVSAEQAWWIESLNRIGCVEAKICLGADEAIKFVEGIINN